MSRLDEPAASASQTHPPAYRALRMAAEWASAVRDHQLNFVYDAGTGHMVLDNSGTRPTLPVFTRSAVSRPLVKEVEFSVPWGFPTSDISPPTLTVSGDRVSALFWSESAVEKFLVPFYASAAADDAPRFLGRLFDAWYGYPADVVQVCAIACLLGRQPPAEGTPLSLARTVGLVCLEEGGSSLRLLTLDEFTERYSTGLPRGGEGVTLGSGPTEVRHGWEITESVESVVARDVAEFVSGMRGHFVAFSTEEATLVPVVYPDTSPPEVIGGALFGALARPVRPDRPVPSHVVLHVVGTDGSPIVQTLIPGQDETATEFVPDSLFWTDGAVETLLVPYYASVKGGDAWLFEGFLMGKWDGLIKPPSSNSMEDLKSAITQRLDRFGHAAGRDAEDPSPSPVYATMHLPRSEYADMAGRTMVLWAQAGTSGTEATASPVWPGQGGAAAPAKRSRKTASRATEARKAGRSAR
ncbi:MAG TPA: hypothetical protein VFR37_04865 [Longimicrobium sp.]|nr:hypothetical protein [Longimicrobium sp.]